MPRPFQFSLQKVLDYRLQLEEEAKQAMAQAQNRYQEQVAAVQRVRDALAAHEEAMYGEDGPSAGEMWLWRNYSQRLQTDLQHEEGKMLQRARELNKARREVVNRSKERKLLEKLKQNKMMRHVQEEQEREQKELDEMATLRFRHDTV